MADTCIEKELDGRNYYLYRHGKNSQKLPIFYWGIMQNQKDAVDKVISYLKAYASDADFVLVAYVSENWNFRHGRRRQYLEQNLLAAKQIRRCSGL